MSNPPLPLPTKNRTVSVLLEPQGPELLKLLLERGDDGETMSHFACYCGDVDIIKAIFRLLPNPTVLSLKNNDGVTPLQLAAMRGQSKIIRMLLILGADPTVRDNYGNTALHLACKVGEEQCVLALIKPISESEIRKAYLECGCSINEASYLKCAQLPPNLDIPNKFQDRCVHLAAQSRFMNILRILISSGADVNAVNQCGTTLLHMAILNSDEDLLNYLLNDCKDLNLEANTHFKLTPYQLAYVCKNTKMKDLLEEHGAKPLIPPGF